MQHEFDNAKDKLEEQRNTNLEFRNNLDEARNRHVVSVNKITETEKLIAVKESQHEAFTNAVRNNRRLFENERANKTLETLHNDIVHTEEKIEKQRLLVEDLRKRKRRILKKNKRIRRKLSKKKTP